MVETELEQLRNLLKEHPDIDICMNSNGIKLGFKGSNQEDWVRYA
jgi:short-subunit dehydrogenase involved in D-alanine esterification of teichoic acids